MSEPSRLDALSKELYGTPSGTAATPEAPGNARLDALSQELYGTTAGAPGAPALNFDQPVPLSPIEATRRVMGETPQPETGGGAVAGQAIGSLAAGAPGGIAGGMAGMAIERRVKTGAWPSWRELAIEGGLSAAGETVARVGSKVLGAVLGRTPPGKQLLAAKAGEELTEKTAHVFQAKAPEVISEAFESVKQSGHKVDVTPAAKWIGELVTPDEAKLLARKSAAFGEVPGRPKGFGQDVYAWLSGQQGRPQQMDIGLLQDYASQVGKEARRSQGHAADVLHDFKRVLDLSIDDALAAGGEVGDIAGTLKQARRDYFVAQSQQDLNALLDRPGIMKSSADGRLRRLDLGRLKQALEHPQSRMEKEVVEKLQAEGHLEEVVALANSLQKRYPIVTLKAPGVDILSEILLSGQGRQIFGQMVTESKGVLEPSAFAILNTTVARPLAQEVLRPRQAGP